MYKKGNAKIFLLSQQKGEESYKFLMWIEMFSLSINSSCFNFHNSYRNYRACLKIFRLFCQTAIQKENNFFFFFFCIPNKLKG